MVAVVVAGVYTVLYLTAALVVATVAVCLAASLLFVCVCVLFPVAMVVFAVWLFTVVFVPWVVVAGPVLYVGGLPWRVNVPLTVVIFSALALPVYTPSWPALFAPVLGWVMYGAFPATVSLLHLLLLAPQLAWVRELCPWLARGVRPGALAVLVALLVAPWAVSPILLFCMFMRDLWEPLGYAVWAFLCFGPMVIGVVAPITAFVMVEVSYWH